jgi:hypothetical protein
LLVERMGNGREALGGIFGDQGVKLIPTLHALQKSRITEGIDLLERTLSMKEDLFFRIRHEGGQKGGQTLDRESSR